MRVKTYTLTVYNLFSTYCKNTRFKNDSSIVDTDQYAHFEDKYCKGHAIEYYPTLQAAKVACSDNSECNCIDDRDCGGDRWSIRKYATLDSSYGSCAWTKGKRWPFSQKKA